MTQPGSFTRAICAGAFALIATPAIAHHPGGASNTGGAGPIFTISASTLEAGHGAVAFLYETIKFGGLGDAALIDAAGKHIHAHSIDAIRSTSLSAAYGVTDDFTVSVRLPYVQRIDIREGHHSHAGGVTTNTVDYRGDSSGIGDVTFLGQWRFFNNQATRTEAAFLFGVKAPTGATNRIDQQGLLFETEFQPGSGSWDVLLGGAFTQRFGAWSFDANVLGIVAGRGVQDTNLGSRVLYNTAVSYRLVGYSAPMERQAALPASAMSHGPVPHRHAHPLDKIPAAPEWTVDAILELNGEWHDYENTAGVKDLNSGGHVLLLSPGLRIARGAFSGFATFGIPIVNQMNGLQSKTEYRVFTGVAYSF
jgi:hypothetical protein